MLQVLLSVYNELHVIKVMIPENLMLNCEIQTPFHVSIYLHQSLNVFAFHNEIYLHVHIYILHTLYIIFC